MSANADEYKTRRGIRKNMQLYSYVDTVNFWWFEGNVIYSLYSIYHIQLTNDVLLDIYHCPFHLFFYFQDQPPPLPPKRGYEIKGVGMVSFPHLKILAASFHEPPHQIMNKGQYKTVISTLKWKCVAGDQVLVTGISHQPSRFLVQKHDYIFHVPFHFFTRNKNL